MTEFCHYQFYTNFALKNMHTKHSQGGEGKAQKESGVAGECGQKTAEGAENRVNKSKRQETYQGDKISRIKDRGEQKKQRGQHRG